MTRLVIFGAKGRMGRVLLTCAGTDPEFEVVGQIDVGDELRAVIAECDVVIDFSSHEATLGMACLLY
ncbi:MAG: 4-hydroxy-tetrahydrodipicolinate reductase, partial [Verrucomicrobiae bacterium]|nr:4-hydroxy-tetrahydrodipicolinate reductase [Verrucomicrobiae bacterium]